MFCKKTFAHHDRRMGNSNRMELQASYLFRTLRKFPDAVVGRGKKSNPTAADANQWVFIHETNLVRQTLRSADIIGIHPGNQLSARELKSSVQGCCEPQIPVIVD